MKCVWFPLIARQTFSSNTHAQPNRVVWRSSSPGQGAAHLPGMTASQTVCRYWAYLWNRRRLHGLDSLLSIAQMPGGVPVGTLAIGKAGPINAALLAAAALGIVS